MVRRHAPAVQGTRSRGRRVPIHDIKLRLSFRSTPHVLKSVDQFFSNASSYEALSSDKEATVHEPIRGRDPGLVEVWPLYEPGGAGGGRGLVQTA